MLTVLHCQLVENRFQLWAPSKSRHLGTCLRFQRVQYAVGIFKRMCHFLEIRDREILEHSTFRSLTENICQIGQFNRHQTDAIRTQYVLAVMLSPDAVDNWERKLAL
jgi:hypothetical protein